MSHTDMGRRRKKPSSFIFMNCPGEVMPLTSPLSTILYTLEVSGTFPAIVNKDCFIFFNYASIVDMVCVVSSSTSSSTLTVSREVNIVALFSVAQRRIR